MLDGQGLRRLRLGSRAALKDRFPKSMHSCSTCANPILTSGRSFQVNTSAKRVSEENSDLPDMRLKMREDNPNSKPARRAQEHVSETKFQNRSVGRKHGLAPRRAEGVVEFLQEVVCDGLLFAPSLNVGSPRLGGRRRVAELSCTGSIVSAVVTAQFCVPLWRYVVLQRTPRAPHS